MTLKMDFAIPQKYSKTIQSSNLLFVSGQTNFGAFSHKLNLCEN